MLPHRAAAVVVAAALVLLLVLAALAVQDLLLEKMFEIFAPQEKQPVG
jgi:hypothetical protein